jgi:CubicO group peptidase (beta-lactamase class C family)
MMSRRDFMLGALAAPAAGGSALGRRFEAAAALVETAVRAGEVDAAVLHVNAAGEMHERAFGHAHDPGAVFLLASITKPMTAAGVMALCEAKTLALDTPIAAQLPALLTSAPSDADRKLRATLTLRHLLTHTSGLPDMPPDNQDLRTRQASLPEFLADALTVPLAFAPGTRVRYQSMGFLLAAEIAQRRAGLPWREHLRRRLFVPLEMTATSLGLGDRPIGQTMMCQVPDDRGGWNSDYWRNLGAPWGGAHGTARDLARMLRFFAHPEAGPLRASTVRAMLTPQTPPGEDPDRRRPDHAGQDHPAQRYGLGFRLGDAFAPGLSPRAFGHGGATGVVAWTDPDKDLTCVLLTTRPEDKNPLLAAVSRVVAAG